MGRSSLLHVFGGRFINKSTRGTLLVLAQAG
jgi:hypothetical protein